MPTTRTILVPRKLGELKPQYFPRLDRFLASSFPDLSRSQVKSLIISGSVLCNNNLVVKPSNKVTPGDTITITLPEPVEHSIEPENIPLDIMYQDDELAVINKPAGMMVHPAGLIVSGTLVNALLFHLNDLSGINGVLKPGIVHRLDKDTSGIMLVAKNDHSHRHLAAQFETRTIEKMYSALVWGLFAEREGEITKSIARSTSDRKKMVSGIRGKESKTRYIVREEFEYLTLLDVYPKTGRTHQIRSHLASAGHPVFGDALYRGRNRRLANLTTSERTEASRLLKLMPRQALHAAEIGFIHPTTHEKLRFAAPIPGDFANVLEILKK